ncbi:Aste57867_11781 [Aphanomyces stellatus]|uniref:Aste57867_11781 protein n=1 Tax=Aphanomyces stellatus TaxID=120398 RepID=A0A485KU51_9STRA|nr:hypothetical protein As57867_011736 [Aphanomyces stellatus]VFT88637.1 Aste57867_11781 [Aphanomyces stellatus]
MKMSGRAAALLSALAIVAAICPLSYAPYNQIATVSQCTTQNASWCIVNGQCQEQDVANNNGFSFDGTMASSLTTFDGLLAEVPATAKIVAFTYAAVDVGDLSLFTNLTTLSLYRMNRANLTKAKLPMSLSTLDLTSVAGLTSLPPLDYSRLTSFKSVNNLLTSVANINLSSATEVSFKANVLLTSITNVELSPTLQSFDCTGCPLTTFVVNPTSYKALSALPTASFVVKSLDVTTTCQAPNVVKPLQTNYTICVTPGSASCPASYAQYNQIATVSQCTTKGAPWCIVNGQCQELAVAGSNGFYVQGMTAGISAGFDGLIAELPAAATSAAFTYVFVDVGDLSSFTNLTSLSFYRMNRADLTKAKLPLSLTTLDLTSIAGLTSLPPLDYSHLATFTTINNRLTSVANLNVSSATTVSFKANLVLASITNIVLSPALQSFDCTGCPLTTFVVDPIGYRALSALPAAAFIVQSLDVSATCPYPNVVKPLQIQYTICVTPDSWYPNPTTYAPDSGSSNGATDMPNITKPHASTATAVTTFSFVVAAIVGLGL